MPMGRSKASRDLSNVMTQLNSKKTRGKHPRDLDPDEIKALEAQRDNLKKQIATNSCNRMVNRIAAHTTQESEATRKAVHEEGKRTREAMPTAAEIAEAVLEKVETEVVPLEKRHEEWITILKRFNVPTLNRLLVQKGKQPRGDKTDKLLALSKLPAHELQKLVTQESATSSDSKGPKPEKSANEQDQKKQKAKGTGDSERAAKRAKQSSSSSSSYSSASSSDSEKEDEKEEEQGQVSSGEEVGAENEPPEKEEEEGGEQKEQEHSKDVKCLPDPVAKWRLSMQNLVHWGASLEHSQIQKFERELKETLEGLEPCTQSEAQFNLMPIVKRCAKGHSVILVECQNDQKVEEDVDRLMHAMSKQTEKRRAERSQEQQQNPPKAFRSPLQESFDESARELAEEKGLVPGVLVFWKGNLQRAWRVEGIRCDRGRAKAMVCDPEPGLVVQHREYEISGLVLAELSDENVPPEPTVEEVLEE